MKLDRKAIQARFDDLEAYWDVVDAHGRCDDHGAEAAFKEHGPADLTSALELVDEQDALLKRCESVIFWYLEGKDPRFGATQLLKDLRGEGLVPYAPGPTHSRIGIGATVDKKP